MEEQKIVNTMENTEEIKDNAVEASEETASVVYPKNKLEELVVKHPKAAIIGGWIFGTVTTGLLGFGVYKLVGKAAGKATKKAIVDTTAKFVEEAPEAVESAASAVATDVAKDVVTTAVEN